MAARQIESRDQGGFHEHSSNQSIELVGLRARRRRDSGDRLGASAARPPPAPQRTADTTLAEWLADKDARVSELIGRRVMNPSGTDLGEVEDLLATAGREQQPVVVLSIGGVLDVGDKWHAASLEQLRIAADNERLVLDKTEAELKAAPDFDYVPMIGEQKPSAGRARTEHDELRRPPARRDGRRRCR